MRDRGSVLPHRSLRFSPALERLERRALLNCTALLEYDMLRVVCDGAADVIRVEQTERQILLQLNDEQLSFPDRDVEAITIQGGEGTDEITFDAERRGFLQAGNGDDLIRVLRTGMGTNSFVACGTPGDRDRVEIGRPGGSAARFRGRLNILEQRAGSLVVYDDGTEDGQSYGIDSEGRFYRGGRELFNYSDSTPSSVHVFTSAGDDSVWVGNLPATRSFHYDLGGGDDVVHVRPENFFGLDVAGFLTVDGGTGTNRVEIDERHNPFGSDYQVGSNSVQRRGAVSWTNVAEATLHAGPFRDRFSILPGEKSPSVNLDAGDGADTLDYGNWLSPVHVTLQGNSASGLVSVVAVEHLRGGAGDDFLLGDNGDNHLDGGPGHDVLLGEEGNDTLEGGDGRDMLLGGPGLDSLHGGTDDDLLISGTTSFDSDRDSLESIRLLWCLEEPYKVRVTVLRSLLNASSVLPDADLDILEGGDGEDWFWADFSEVVDWEWVEAIR